MTTDESWAVVEDWVSEDGSHVYRHADNSMSVLVTPNEPREEAP